MSADTSDTLHRSTLSATTMIGNPVRNSDGEDLGTFKEIMLDVSSGRIAYAVLNMGGFLGLGNKLFAVPWPTLTLDGAEHQFLFDISKERLENAPGFDQDHWPDFSSREWGLEIHSYYGQPPYWD